MSTTKGSAETLPLHLYKVDEAGCVWHWVAATDADEAVRLVIETGSVEEPDDLEVWELPDDQSHTVTFVDGWDDPDRWQEECPPGAVVEYIREGVPQVTATAGEWARSRGRPGYAGCSEY